MRWLPSTATALLLLVAPIPVKAGGTKLPALFVGRWCVMAVGGEVTTYYERNGCEETDRVRVRPDDLEWNESSCRVTKVTRMPVRTPTYHAHLQCGGEGQTGSQIMTLRMEKGGILSLTQGASGGAIEVDHDQDNTRHRHHARRRHKC